MYPQEYDNDEQMKAQAAVEIKKFNWGAMFLGVIWAAYNGAWKFYWPYLIAIAVALLSTISIPFVGSISGIVPLGIAIYTGIKGNEWAWNGTRKWDSIDQFNEVQKKWTIAGIIVAAVSLLIQMFLFAVISVAFSTIFKTPSKAEKKEYDRYTELNQDALSMATYDAPLTTYKTSEELANAFKNSTKRTVKIDLEDAEMYNSTSVKVDAFMVTPDVIFTFEKQPTCTLKERNCYVMLSVKDGDGAIPKVKSYFNDQKATLSTRLYK